MKKVLLTLTIAVACLGIGCTKQKSNSPSVPFYKWSIYDSLNGVWNKSSSYIIDNTNDTSYNQLTAYSLYLYQNNDRDYLIVDTDKKYIMINYDVAEASDTFAYFLNKTDDTLILAKYISSTIGWHYEPLNKGNGGYVYTYIKKQ